MLRHSTHGFPKRKGRPSQPKQTTKQRKKTKTKKAKHRIKADASSSSSDESTQRWSRKKQRGRRRRKEPPRRRQQVQDRQVWEESEKGRCVKKGVKEEMERKSGGGEKGKERKKLACVFDCECVCVFVSLTPTPTPTPTLSLSLSLSLTASCPPAFCFAEPIVPKVCTNCAALYTPVKDGKECALCTQAKESNALFSSLSASIAARANGEDTLPPLKEESTAAAAVRPPQVHSTRTAKQPAFNICRAASPCSPLSLGLLVTCVPACILQGDDKKKKGTKKKKAGSVKKKKSSIKKKKK